ncbi:MAG TPA: uroporphyrinogen decarboxylase family protein [Armatimonadota bacterium]|nr:uroporphyrinogen decarboxylase family protein [Armatimonadota bacterium]
MTGRDIALGTLHREAVPFPCINYCWMTHTRYMSHVAGREYWDDPEGVFIAYVRRSGANLVPQWYYPDEGHRRLEAGEVMHAIDPHVRRGFREPEDVLRYIERLPSDEAVEREFNVEVVAEAYGGNIRQRMEQLGPDVLVIDGFGQADFMGGYSQWGYENYLAASALWPEAMHHYYHHTAVQGRLMNHAIALACERYGLAPFVYGGQDICTAKGPIMSPAALREIYFPELKWCLEPLVEAGIGIVWHCDGDIRPILGDILDLGVIGLQGFEEEHGVDYGEMARLRDAKGRPIAIWGCVSVTSTLPHGTADDVRRAVERSFTIAGPGRGFVLSSTSSVMPEVPLENVDALFTHGRQFGREYLGG